MTELLTSLPAAAERSRRRRLFRRAQGPALFAVLIALQLASFLFLIVGRRIPAWHDGFQYFSLQYDFLNSAATSGQIPRWMPYMTHGTVATWWFSVQAGLLQNVLLYVAPLLRHVNLIYPFHAGMLVDELLLLTGTWLLARRFLRPPAAFFVCVCVMGSAIWVDQPWHNFHFYYAVPLVLELLHRFFETGRWRYFCFAGNLLAVQTLGNLPYLIPATSFIIAAYVAFFFGCNPGRITGWWWRTKWGWPAAGALAVVAISFAAAFLLVRVGTADIVNYEIGRNPDGSTQLRFFLTYALNNDLAKWGECIIGISPCLDYTLYVGMLAVPLAAIGLLTLPRRLWHLPLLAGTLLLISAGTWLARGVYYAWPMMKYYRHLALLCPYIKVIGCFVAGWGFQVVFGGTMPWRRIRRVMPLLGVAAGVLMLFLAWQLWYQARWPAVAGSGLQSYLDSPSLPPSPLYNNWSLRQPRLYISSGFALLAAVLLAIASLRRWQPNRTLIAAALIVATLDLCAFKTAHLLLRTRALGPQETLTETQPMPFAPRRLMTLEDVPRFKQLRAVTDINGPGARYWSTNAFVFADEVGSTFRVDHWLWPLDHLMKAFGGQPLDDPRVPPKGWSPYIGLEFPLSSPAAKKVTGVTEDRVQFFAAAHDCSSDASAAAWLADPRFTGDSLVLAADPSAPKSSNETSGGDPSANDRLHLPYEVTRFDANSIDIAVNNDRPAPAWLVYCDTWHPGWSASVNGLPAPVRRANIAYKAMLVPPGRSVAQFRFRLPILDWLDRGLALNSLAWLIALAWIDASILHGLLPRARPRSFRHRASISAGEKRA